MYAYAYGQLLALSVYRRYLEEGEAFVPALRRAAGRRRVAAPPRSWARIVGVDLADPGFWDAGLDLVDDQLAAAERRGPRSARQEIGGRRRSSQIAT